MMMGMMISLITGVFKDVGYALLISHKFTVVLPGNTFLEYFLLLMSEVVSWLSVAVSDCWK